MDNEQKISDEAGWAFDEGASAHRKKHGGTFRHCCTRAGIEAAYSLLRKRWEAEHRCVTVVDEGPPEFFIDDHDRAVIGLHEEAPDA